MDKDVIIAIAEDNDGHAALITKNLKRAGIINKIVRFKNGIETCDYLFRTGEVKRPLGVSILLLLDLRMPGMDGLEVLQKIKTDNELKKIPVIMVTTTDDPLEIDKCHQLGCSTYVTKPVNYDKFVETIKQLGLFLKVVELPSINGIS